MPEPATMVNESELVSATTFDCPDTCMVEKLFIAAPAMVDPGGKFTELPEAVIVASPS